MRVAQRIVIVYESFFGNSRHVAEAIAAGMRTSRPDAQVTCVTVTEADPEVARGADLLVVGGPTHLHGMSSTISRRLALRTDAARDTHEVPEGQSPRLGLRELVRTFPRVPWGTRAAAFDTHGEGRGVGGAAPCIARRLRAHGYTLVSRPTGFVVTGVEGALADGELTRAAAWGASLLSRADLSARTS